MQYSCTNLLAAAREQIANSFMPGYTFNGSRLYVSGSIYLASFTIAYVINLNVSDQEVHAYDYDDIISVHLLITCKLYMDSLHSSIIQHSCVL